MVERMCLSPCCTALGEAQEVVRIRLISGVKEEDLEEGHTDLCLTSQLASV